MRSVTMLLGAVAAGVLLASAGSAGAITIFTPIDQPTLDTFGSATFGATTTDLGLFTHTFTFTTTGSANASSSIVSIQLQSGQKDIDLSSVTLDGNAYTETGFDPSAETWSLASAALGSGAHAIVVMGTVVTLGPGSGAASYSGTLNVETLTKGGGTPEPDTWALLIMGFGGAGGMLRARRRTLKTVA